MDQSDARRSLISPGAEHAVAKGVQAACSARAAERVLSERPLSSQEAAAQDHSLSFLRALIAREHQSHWERFGFSPEWTFEITPMDHLEGENAGKYLVTFFSESGAPQKTVFLKQYHHPEIGAATIENEFQGIRIAHEALAKSARFRVPRPYGRLPEEKILFMEYCPSVSLKKAIFRPIRFSRFFLPDADRGLLVRWAAEAGRLLSAFQQIPVECHPVAGKETPEGIALRYEKQFHRHLRLCRKASVPEALIGRIERAGLRCLQKRRPLPSPILQHSDFGPWNLMVAEPYLYLTDFQNFTAGFPGYDAAFFYCALELLLRYRTIDRARVVELQSIFLRAFFGGTAAGAGPTPIEAAEALPYFDLFRLMHMVYFAQSVYCAPPAPAYETLYAVPLRGFVVDWFQHHLEG